MNIIIIGKMSSGKTTVAKFLSKKLPSGKCLTLAEPIKQLVKNIDELSDSELLKKFIYPFYDPTKSLPIKCNDLYIFEKKIKNILFETRKIPNEIPKPRKRLQYLGTDGIRKQIDNMMWIKMALNKTKKHPDYSWIIDDCRFINEYEAFTSMGWQPVFLHISPDEHNLRLCKLYGNYDKKILDHPSEKEIDSIKIPTNCIFLTEKLKEIKLNKILNFLNSRH